MHVLYAKLNFILSWFRLKKEKEQNEPERVGKKKEEEKLLTIDEMEDEWQNELDNFVFTDRITGRYWSVKATSGASVAKLLESLT